MFLLESRSKAVDASVAIEAERAGVVADGVPVGVDEDRWLGKFVEDGADGGFHGGGEVEGGALLE